ncbi:hypothetical protein CAOG_009876 [Capsaspora owczarzaki ATCC 30864]|uniref:Uncharacterized protein n=1 Tax=Capsaspora owczarzaki (strain ATCC 30864) TaxID=595528 RepID=A0A0D2UJ82_CAPO3|nr:hypothetical protein CAOG_009876 [Capsaspora owczarzaki ATCC 30864]
MRSKCPVKVDGIARAASAALRVPIRVHKLHACQNMLRSGVVHATQAKSSCLLGDASNRRVGDFDRGKASKRIVIFVEVLAGVGHEFGHVVVCDRADLVGVARVLQGLRPTLEVNVDLQLRHQDFGRAINFAVDGVDERLNRSAGNGVIHWVLDDIFKLDLYVLHGATGGRGNGHVNDATVRVVDLDGHIGRQWDGVSPQIVRAVGRVITVSVCVGANVVDVDSNLASGGDRVSACDDDGFTRSLADGRALGRSVGTRFES